MEWAFIESLLFMARRDEYFSGDEHYRRFQEYLARAPCAPVMPGCGGLRKIRWPDPRRGKGRRGGLRIIYLLVPETGHIVFFGVYDKSDADDLTAVEKRELATLAAQIKDAIVNRYGRSTP